MSMIFPSAQVVAKVETSIRHKRRIALKRSFETTRYASGYRRVGQAHVLA